MDTRTTPFTSEWYSSIQIPRGRLKNVRPHLPALNRIRELVRDIKSFTQSGSSEKADKINELRFRLHEAEFWGFLSPILMRTSHILEENGLQRIFTDPGDDFPPDLMEDSEVLYRMWMNGDLDAYLLRGIVTVNRRNNSTAQEKITRGFEKDYPFASSCNHVGKNDLVNGQWWPLQMFVSDAAGTSGTN